MTLRLDPAAAPWLEAPETLRLFAALDASGRQSRFVGGAVRDALQGTPAAAAALDLDIATQNRPEEVMALLQAAGLRAIPTGLAHGTVTARVGDRSFEITTLRRDISTDGRHAEVSFTDDFVADAARRDFTINALSCTLDGIIHDPFDGAADLRTGHISFVGDPRQRVREDYLRILRFFRFYARFGQGAPDPAALRACHDERQGLQRLSGERIWSELKRLLATVDPRPSLRAMQAAGIAELLFGRPLNLASLDRLLPLDEDRDAIRRLAALLDPAHADPASPARLAERLKLSGLERQRLQALLLGDPPDRLDDAASLRRFAYLARQEVPGIALDRILLEGARQGIDPTRLAGILAEAGLDSLPVFPLTGQDLLDRGIASGPELGRLRREVEQRWLESGFTLDRKASLAVLDELLAGPA